MFSFGIIGCGRIAPRHAEAIKQISGTRIVAVADIIRDKASAFSALYGGEAYQDYRYLLDRKDIDIVCICTPSGLHAKMAIDAAQAGKHIILEKPLALSISDAKNLISQETQTGVKIGVVYQYRFMPLIQELYQLVQRHALGQLLLCNSTVRWYRSPEYYLDGWHGTKAHEGGVFMNQIIHFVDLMQWLMGSVQSVFAYTSTLMHSIETEDAGVAVLRFENDAMGTIEGSTITFPNSIEGSLTIIGGRGTVKIGGIQLDKKVIWNGEMLGIMENRFDNNLNCSYYHQLIIDDLLRAILGNRQPFVNCVEAFKSLAIVQGIYNSAQTGKESKPIKV